MSMSAGVSSPMRAACRSQISGRRRTRPDASNASRSASMSRVMGSVPSASSGAPDSSGGGGGISTAGPSSQGAASASARRDGLVHLREGLDGAFLDDLRVGRQKRLRGRRTRLLDQEVERRRSSAAGRLWRLGWRRLFRQVVERDLDLLRTGCGPGLRNRSRTASRGTGSERGQRGAAQFYEEGLGRLLGLGFERSHRLGEGRRRGLVESRRRGRGRRDEEGRLRLVRTPEEEGAAEARMPAPARRTRAEEEAPGENADSGSKTAGGGGSTSKAGSTCRTEKAAAGWPSTSGSSERGRRRRRRTKPASGL